MIFRSTIVDFITFKEGFLLLDSDGNIFENEELVLNCEISGDELQIEQVSNDVLVVANQQVIWLLIIDFLIKQWISGWNVLSVGLNSISDGLPHSMAWRRSIYYWKSRTWFLWRNTYFEWQNMRYAIFHLFSKVWIELCINMTHL